MMGTPPLPPKSHPVPAGSNDDRVLRAIMAIDRKLDAFATNVTERLVTLERNDKRHDTGLLANSEDDAKRASDQAALVIAINDTRSLASSADKKIDAIVREQKAANAETSAQTPMLARVESQTNGFTIPLKGAAAVNLVLGTFNLVAALLKAFGKH